MVRQRRSSFSRRAPALLVIAALAFAGLLSAETMNPSTAAASPVTSASPKPTTTAQKSAAVGPTAVDDSVTVGYPAIIKLAGPSNDKAGSSPIVPSLTVFPTDGQTRGTTIKDGGHTIEVANHGAFNIGNGAPNANFETWVGRTGTVSVRYRITDANGLTADGLLTVVVTAGGAYDNVDAYQGTTVTGVDVLTNDTPGRNADGTAGTLDPGSVRFPHQQYADVTSVSTDGRTATFEDGSGAAFDAQGLLTFTAATASSDEETGGAAFYTARDTTVAADGTVQHHAYQSEVRLYGDVNHVTSNLTSLPSGGAKGGLLIVDSHFDPLRRTGAEAELDPTTLKNMPSRAQSSNAAFGLHNTYPFTECITDAAFTEYCTDVPASKPVKTFTDNQGWVPGLEVRPTGIFWRDVDASVVVPSVGGQPYSTRIVNPDGSPATDYYGEDLGFGLAGSGNPADAGAGYGTKVEVQAALFGNRIAFIRITPPRAG